jgi:hypothetical protein
VLNDDVLKSFCCFSLPHVEERKMNIAVSGHLVNLLLKAHFEVVDFRRYMEVIEDNIKNALKLVTTAQQRLVLRIPGESGSDDGMLWHNYIEWKLAIYVYLFLASRMFGKIHKWILIRNISLSLDILAKKYIDFIKTDSFYVISGSK